MTAVIEAEGLTKRYGSVTALDGLDLSAQAGTVLGLLSPNGAGKTSAVRVLTTLLRPDSGRARVAGMDVLKHPEEVRRRIGLSGQYAAVDETLTGYENLEMIGRLYRPGRRRGRAQAWELLERFTLTDAARRAVKTYSGGMRRRLDLAGSLVAEPSALFPDEPTTGLDPRGRVTMWEVVCELVGQGTTLLLTTQYLEEVDRLAAGPVVVGEQGTSLTAPVKGGSDALMQVLRELDAAEIDLLDVGLRRPTLDDLFLARTGQPAEDGVGADAEAGGDPGGGSRGGSRDSSGAGSTAEEVGP